MSINNVGSSMLQEMIAAQNNNQTSAPVQNIQASPNTNTPAPVTNNIKNISGKKLAIGAAAAAGIAALALGGIYLHKTSAKSIQKLGEQLKDKADDVLNWAKKELDEVTNIFNKDKDQLTDGIGEIKDEAGNIIRRYTKADDMSDECRFLEEFADDGKTIVRESMLNLKYNDCGTDIVDTIKKFTKGSKKYNSIHNYETLSVNIGRKDTAKKLTSKENFDFKDGNLVTIMQNAKRSSGTLKCKNLFEYSKDGTLENAGKFYKENDNSVKGIFYSLNDDNKFVKNGWKKENVVLDEDDFNDDFLDDFDDDFFDIDD